MQQFRALLNKELGGYFQSYFAYAVIFVYLFVSVGSAYYFGSYLAAHDTAVYSLFYIQPLVQIALLPALTMKLWSEEYRTGTAEFLLTQPLSFRTPVLAKFAAAFLFAMMMSLFLLPFIYYTSRTLALDWGNVVCSYVGLELLIFLFCAVGTWISAMNKHIILAYLLSVFVTALWLAMPFTKLYDIYNNFLLAEIGLSDVLYFVLFGAAILFLNTTVMQLRYSAQKHKKGKFALFCIFILLGVGLFNTAIALLFSHKADFTAHKFYTPQAQSKEVIAAVEIPTSVDVYIAKDFKSHNVEYFRYYQQVKRFLQKYAELSDNMIKVNVTEVEPFSQMESLVLNYGLYYEENAEGTKDYFGAVIHDNNGQGVTIKQFLAARSRYLEKDIDTALLKLADERVMKTIGVYMDPSQELENFQGFLLNLENDYNILNISGDVYELSPRLELLILINPKQMLPIFKYAVDQYILNGGKVIILFDLLTEKQSDYVNLSPLSVVDFFNKWGVLLGEDLVESGEPAAEFVSGDLPLNLFKAAEFEVNNPKLRVKPIIRSGERYIGALIEGILPSVFAESPVQDAKLKAQMMPHSLYSAGDAKVAIIGDVDLIDDDNWVAASSPDKNPYSAVNKAVNVELLRNLIDEMVQNQVYRNLPLRNEKQNTFSIGEKFYTQIFERYEPLYIQINEAIEKLKIALFESSGQNPDKMAQLLQVSEAGQQIAELETQSEGVLYQMKELYSRAIRFSMLLNILIVPMATAGLLYALMAWARRRRKKQVLEMFDE
ncbi:MAG: Gldg family protein [Alphaproteobacteria bacterium]|nr:Gldg family protein [Alphaproteobacteria bacterium]